MVLQGRIIGCTKARRLMSAEGDLKVGNNLTEKRYEYWGIINKNS